MNDHFHILDGHTGIIKIGKQLKKTKLKQLIGTMPKLEFLCNGIDNSQYLISIYKYLTNLSKTMSIELVWLGFIAYQPL